MPLVDGVIFADRLALHAVVRERPAERQQLGGRLRRDGDRSRVLAAKRLHDQLLGIDGEHL
eukprot:5726492-Pleurochrysis_carterae.AAC.1